MSITEQEARERERNAYVRAWMEAHKESSTSRMREAEEFAVRAYPAPVTYGPAITTPGDAGQELRRLSDGQWETRRYGGWGGWIVSPYITDAYVLALASCVPVTDAEVIALTSDGLRDCMMISAERVRGWLTTARAAMRPEGTR